MLELDERYTTLNTKINTLTNKFVADWLEYVGDVVEDNSMLYTGLLGDDIKAYNARYPVTDYDNLFLYFHLLFSTNYKIYKAFSEKYKIEGYEVRIKLAKTKEIARHLLGYTRQYLGNKRQPYICIQIPQNIIYGFSRCVTNEEKLDYNKIRDFVSQIKSTLAHELTHYFQIKKDGHNFLEDYVENNSLTGSYTSYLSFFNYFIQETEMNAVLNSAYRRYREKYVERSFYDCVVLSTIERVRPELADRFFSGELSFFETFKKINCLGKFLLIWVLYDYVPNNSKYGPLLAMSDEYESEMTQYFNKNVVKANKKNLENFIRTNMQEDYGMSLNRYLSELPSNEFVDVHKEMFSLKKYNKKFLEKLNLTLDEI